ncbi:MAG TPA: peptidoglycan-associated lipoprotein Pal [Burkholderiales bacterium]|nr:peptidoglycan-associated lipoprotein Pal [Burkholderiales bacterium]
MKKIILSILLAGLLASCASKEAKEESTSGTGTAKVEEAPVTGGAAPMQPQQQPKPGAVRAQAAPAERSIYFDFDKSIIKDQYQPLVKAHAQYLTNNSSARITIQGNCDERGSREYNLGLGQRRADSEKHALTVLGVSKSQIETVSFGKEKPRCTEHNESCWSQNRRADIVYQGE